MTRLISINFGQSFQFKHSIISSGVEGIRFVSGSLRFGTIFCDDEGSAAMHFRPVALHAVNVLSPGFCPLRNIKRTVRGDKIQVSYRLYVLLRRHTQKTL